MDLVRIVGFYFLLKKCCYYICYIYYKQIKLCYKSLIMIKTIKCKVKFMKVGRMRPTREVSFYTLSVII